MKQQLKEVVIPCSCREYRTEKLRNTESKSNSLRCRWSYSVLKKMQYLNKISSIISSLKWHIDFVFMEFLTFSKSTTFPAYTYYSQTNRIPLHHRQKKTQELTSILYLKIHDQKYFHLSSKSNEHSQYKSRSLLILP